MEVKKKIRQKEIWWVEFYGGKGSEQTGWKPGVVTSNNKANGSSPTFNVIPLTSKLGKAKIPVHITVNKDCGVSKKSIALVEQKTTASVLRFGSRIGKCTDNTWKQIEVALKIQDGQIEPYINFTYVRNYLQKITNIDMKVSNSGYINEEDYTVLSFKKAFILGELIAYCKNYNKDYKAIINGRIPLRQH